VSAVLKAREPELAASHLPLSKLVDVLACGRANVAQLRQAILSLAVRGKLMPRNLGDEPASELLARIQSKRIRPDSATKIAHDESWPKGVPEEVPFELPLGWSWAVLPQLCAIAGGSTPSKAVSSNWRGEIPWVSPKDMKVPVIEDAQDHVSTVALSSGLSLIPRGSLLVVVRGMILAHSFPVAETAVPVTINQDMKAFTPIDADVLPFLALVCRGMRPEILALVERSTHGTCKLESAKLFALRIPVPPLAEQARIVARVDELMRLCDALEAKGRLEAEQHARLLSTLLGTLTDSTTPEELAANWQRVATHFDLLLDRPEAVDALEQTILRLAVRGLLVPTSAQVRAGWTSTRIGNAVDLLNGYAFKSEWFKNAGIRLVRNVNVSHGQLDWSQAAFVPASLLAEFAQFELREGDVVLSLDRPIISTGLKLASIRANDLPCMLLQRVARLKPDEAVLTRDYMVLWLQSDLFVDSIAPGRSNGVPHISTKQVAALSLHLPPLAEQARIVARVTELRRLCTDLGQRLAAQQTVQSHLADALVEQALA